MINLHHETVKNIEIYLKENKIADGFLLPSRSNKNLNGQMSTRGLRQIVKNIFNELGIEKCVHGCRHWFITHLVESYQGNLLEVMNYSRHASLEMLQIYYDKIQQKQDLPRYYKTFNKIKFL